MKPIIKKYASKDLNIAYNDGYTEGKNYMRKVNHSDTLNLTNQFNAGYKKGIKESQTVGFAIKKELSVKEDRKQIAGIIKMNLPLMNKNPMFCQDVADAIIFCHLEKESLSQDCGLDKQLKELEAKRKYWENKYKKVIK